MAVIEYKGVEIERGAKVVVKDATFTVEKGEFCYLLGRVGSGKSSLLKSMYGEVPISGGSRADVMGYDVIHLRRKEIPYLRRRIGIVFQDFQLLQDRSARENLRFVLRATGWHNRVEIEERIDEVLRAVGMETKSYKMPHELSGGEQQRIVIARALLNNPELILADEPTGNLDSQAGYQIVKLLHELASEGTAVVMATHNLQMLEDFPARILRCGDGELSGE